MKKKLLLFLLTILPFFSFAQPNTDIFLFDLKATYNSIELLNNRNISSNEGYDNQPSFLDSNTIQVTAPDFSSKRKRVVNVFSL